KSFKARQEKKAIEWIKQAIQGYSFVYPIDSGLYESDDLEGPRLELRLVDGLGRQWEGPSVTLVVYPIKTWPFNKGNEPVILKRQVWGSLNRVVALLIERFEGMLPLRLAPE